MSSEPFIGEHVYIPADCGLFSPQKMWSALHELRALYWWARVHTCRLWVIQSSKNVASSAWAPNPLLVSTCTYLQTVGYSVLKKCGQLCMSSEPFIGEHVYIPADCGLFSPQKMWPALHELRTLYWWARVHTCRLWVIQSSKNVASSAWAPSPLLVSTCTYLQTVGYSVLKNVASSAWAPSPLLVSTCTYLQTVGYSVLKNVASSTWALRPLLVSKCTYQQTVGYSVLKNVASSAWALRPLLVSKYTYLQTLLSRVPQ